MSRVTDEMTRRVYAAAVREGLGKLDGSLPHTKAALEAVEAELCAQGPFVLSEREQAACDHIAKQLNSRAGCNEPYELVLAALERARRTLGTPEPGQRVSYRCPSCGDGVVGPYIEAEDYPVRLSAKPVAQELAADDASFLGDCEADLAFGDSLTRDEYARLVAIIRKHFPKPAPISPADPVRELVATWRGDAGIVGPIAHDFADQLEAALAARDAQKVGK